MAPHQGADLCYFCSKHNNFDLNEAKMLLSISCEMANRLAPPKNARITSQFLRPSCRKVA